MAAAQIAFFHVGAETIYPTILVRSLRANNPKIRIWQCTDQTTPRIEGVDEVLRLAGDASHLMTFRLECFAQLAIAEPTLFLDTDMICVRPLDLGGLLDGCEVAVCRRDYGRDTLLDPNAMGIDLREYAGRTLDNVYPYLACAVAADRPDFWIDCRDALYSMPRKFHVWFGDQEAMRRVIDSGKFKVGWLRESVYACLVDVETDQATNPKICHFKGPARKALMLECARRAGFLEWSLHATTPPAGSIRVLFVNGIRFDFTEENYADLALQRTAALVAMGGGDALGRWFASGDKEPIMASLRRPGALQAFLVAVLRDVEREVAELERAVDLAGIDSLASIGPGFCLLELMLYRRHACRQYLIDIERSLEHRHGFFARGSGYSSNAVARQFMETNGVPGEMIGFCNPLKQPLDYQPVDLILSAISMGFHYPVSEYVEFITRALAAGGILIFDKRKGVIDPGWDRLAPLFEQRVLSESDKAQRLICRRR